MSVKKKIVSIVVLIVIAIQFIQPAHNKSEQASTEDFMKVFSVPENIQAVLGSACYDCHSNNTVYPWYSNIQPGAWFMSRHITEGKKLLNFSEFGMLSKRRQASKLKEISNQIKDNQMPPWSYEMMHKKARLTTEQKKIVIDWINKAVDSISNQQAVSLKQANQIR